MRDFYGFGIHLEMPETTDYELLNVLEKAQAKGYYAPFSLACFVGQYAHQAFLDNKITQDEYLLIQNKAYEYEHAWEMNYSQWTEATKD